MRWSGTPETKWTQSSRPSFVMTVLAWLSGRRLPMIVSSMWRSVRSLATASSRNLRPFIATSADAVVTRWPGRRSTLGDGKEELGVDAHRHDVELVEVDAVVGADVALRRLGHGHHAGHPLADLGLHLRERVPATLAEPLPRSAGVLELELAIDGDRVVDRLEDRPALLLQFQQAPAEGLVVVDEIEVVAPGAQMTPGPQAERHRFGEVAGAERDVFGDVGPVLPFPDAGLAHRVGVAPDVEAGSSISGTRSSRIGYGGPPRTSTWCPRSTSALLRWRT